MDDNLQANLVLERLKEFIKESEMDMDICLKCMLIAELEILNIHLNNLDNTIYKSA